MGRAIALQKEPETWQTVKRTEKQETRKDCT